MEKYIEAELELLEFDAQDVIATSCSGYSCSQDCPDQCSCDDDCGCYDDNGLD